MATAVKPKTKMVLDVDIVGPGRFSASPGDAQRERCSELRYDEVSMAAFDLWMKLERLESIYAKSQS